MYETHRHQTWEKMDRWGIHCHIWSVTFIGSSDTKKLVTVNFLQTKRFKGTKTCLPFLFKSQLVFAISEETLVILVLVTISKAVISGAFAGIYVVTAETFPSEMRAATINFLNSFGKCIGLLAPFIAHLVHNFYPFMRNKL